MPVCNAGHVNNVPGRKIDLADAEWLTQLLECRRLADSFIPRWASRRSATWSVPGQDRPAAGSGNRSKEGCEYDNKALVRQQHFVIVVWV